MNRKNYQRFVRDGGRTFTLHFSAPLATYADQAAEAEGRTYKELFRRAIEEYVRKHHPSLFQTGEEANNA